MQVESIIVLINILIEEMDLDSQQIAVYNQKFDIPANFDIFLYLSYLSGKAYGSTIGYDTIDAVFTEIKTIQVQQIIGIDIVSRGDQAQLRKEEIILAFNSTFARQQMAEADNVLKIANLPISFLDLSNLEGPAILNRYHIELALLTLFQKQKAVSYYNQFPTKILVRK